MIFNASIKEINSQDRINKIILKSAFGDFVMFALELPEGLKAQDKVELGFNNSDVILSQNKENIKTHNVFKVKIKNINSTDIITSLLCQIKDEYEFEAFLSTCFAKDLKVGDEIYAYVLETSIFISEFL